MEQKTNWQKARILLARYYNQIQFMGYQTPSLVLALKNHLHGPEAYAALSLLLGSTLTFFFDTVKRPSLLFYGAISVVAGGFFLAKAGYMITGASIVLASLEMARGGLRELRTYLEKNPKEKTGFNILSYKLGFWSLFVYAVPVEIFCHRFKAIGTFINERPFLTGSIIKAPLRMEFVIRNAVNGDWINVGIGLSWAILGDGALALNDDKLRAWIAGQEPEQANSKPNPSV